MTQADKNISDEATFEDETKDEEAVEEAVEDNAEQIGGEQLEIDEGGEGNSELHEQLAEAKAEIQALKAQLVSSQDKYLRSLADFENFKKRAQKERSELLKYQGESLVIDLISVIDDLDLAIQFNDGQYKDSDPEKFRQGIELIYKGFCEVLKKWDIRAESSLGKLFDPVKHLAISRIVKEEVQPGTVLSELKKVFYYKDKILRVGEVVVASDPAN
jgi:molecular chaperone GrpE